MRTLILLTAAKASFAWSSAVFRLAAANTVSGGGSARDCVASQMQTIAARIRAIVGMTISFAPL